MGVNTAAGAKISIGTTASVGATDTYTLIGSVVNVPEFGRVYNEITFLPLDTRAVQKFKGSFNDGSIAVQLGRDVADAGQIAALTARDADFDYNFKVELNDKVAPVSSVVTITIAAPGAITWTAHGLVVGTPVSFSTTGALPTGITAGTTYFVKTVVDANTINIAATAGGVAITTTGTQSGVHTGTTVPANTFEIFKAKVMSLTLNIGSTDGVVGATMNLGLKSGSIAETQRIPLS